MSNLKIQMIQFFEVSSIRNYAFYGCSSLEQIIIPSSITSIGAYTFYDCRSLSQITIPTIHSIYKCAFYRCSSLTKVIIQSYKLYVGELAFFKCEKLSEFIQEENVKDSNILIGPHAFHLCSSLHTFKIEYISDIEDYAFANCSSLTQLNSCNISTKIGI